MSDAQNYCTTKGLGWAFFDMCIYDIGRTYHNDDVDCTRLFWCIL